MVDIDDFTDIRLARWFALGKNTSNKPLSRRERFLSSRRLSWARDVHRRVGESDTERIVVSALDAHRLAGSPAHIIPNAYPVGSAPGPCRLDERANVIVFVGLQTYQPNADASHWFAEQVLPLILAELPDAEFRIIGTVDDEVRALGLLPNVRVLGKIVDLRRQLDEAKLVVAPLRVGAGSRIKILEAMACCIPVVSTSVGAEGIEVIDGLHLLLAESAGEFATACVLALTCTEQTAALVRNAKSLVEAMYSPQVIERKIQAAASYTIVRAETPEA